MPSPDLLESAGQRAAFRPVPIPPSVDELATEVDRRRTNRRRAIGGGVAALALVLGLPLGASLIGDGQPADVVTFAADDVIADTASDAAVAVQPAETSTTSTSSTTTTPDSDADTDLGPFAGIDREDFDLSMNFGDTSFSIEVVTGGDAVDRAAAAEAAASSIRTIDDETVWLDEQGDKTTAAALFDGDTFVSVTGPTSNIDQVLDLMTEHADGPIDLFDLEDFSERFDIPDDIFNGDLEFDFDGDGVPEDLDKFFEDGTFPDFDDEAMNDFRRQMDEFAECMQSELDRSGDSTTIEIPDCDLPRLDGVITPGFSEFFDGQTFGDLFDEDSLDDLTKDLDDLLDDAFDDAEDALKEAEDALEDAS